MTASGLKITRLSPKKSKITWTIVKIAELFIEPDILSIAMSIKLSETVIYTGVCAHVVLRFPLGMSKMVENR